MRGHVKCALHLTIRRIVHFPIGVSERYVRIRGRKKGRRRTFRRDGWKLRDFRVSWSAQQPQHPLRLGY